MIRPRAKLGVGGAGVGSFFIKWSGGDTSKLCRTTDPQVENRFN